MSENTKKIIINCIILVAIPLLLFSIFTIFAGDTFSIEWIFSFIIIAIIVLVAAVMLGEHQKKSLAEKSSKLYDFHPTHTYGDFLADTKSGRWMVSYYSGTSRPYHISEVIGWELVENGQRYKSDGGVFRAVVGGALFGGAGAIVGASTANKVKAINHLAVNIYTSDVNTPLVVVSCHSGSTIKADSFQYSVACENARNIIAILQAMQFRYEQNATSSEDSSVNNNLSADDYIPKIVINTNVTNNIKCKKNRPVDIIVKFIINPHIMSLCHFLTCVWHNYYSF